MKKSEKKSFLAEYIKSSGEAVYYIICRDGRDRQCFYVLICSPQKFRMLQDVKEGVVDVSKYAKILASGFGTKPEPEVITHLQQEYGLKLEA